MRIYHRTRVSNFRPVVARAIVNRYSNEGDTVLDFAAGYGGRLLGTVVLKRHYLGIDAARAQVAGLKRTANAMVNRVPGTAELHHGCAEDMLPLMPTQSVKLVFTSPPFFSLERYSTEQTQSYIRYPSYETWREKFLFNVMQQAQRVLKRGGWLVLNLTDGARYRLLTDAKACGQAIFGRSETLRFPIYCIPSLRQSYRHYRWDYLIALQKT